MVALPTPLPGRPHRPNRRPPNNSTPRSDRPGALGPNVLMMFGSNSGRPLSCARNAVSDPGIHALKSNGAGAAKQPAGRCVTDNRPARYHDGVVIALHDCANRSHGRPPRAARCVYPSQRPLEIDGRNIRVPPVDIHTIIEIDTDSAD